MKIKVNKVEESRTNKAFLVLNYQGGDADTDHPKEVGLGLLPIQDSIVTLTPEIIAIVEKYKVLKQALRDNDSTYEKVKEEYGEEIAHLYEDVPNDPQGDYQFKCYLGSIHLEVYDSEGAKYKAYL